MGCGGCGSRGIRPPALAARNRLKAEKPPRVRGYSGSGIVKSAKRLAQEAGTLTLPKPDEVDESK